MAKILTNNIGLKLLSVIVAIILWIVVINVDDPVITRVYTGIPVEVTNESALSAEGKTYEIAEGSETISVNVTAERSVIEALSKENIKATADLKNLTFMNSVPIELKVTRYSERINSISSRTSNLAVIIEERKDRQIKLSVDTTGKVAKGYVAGDVIPDVDVVKITGPESKVNRVNKAEITVDFADMNESFTTSCPIVLYDASGERIDDPSIDVSKSEIRTSVEILETKEIPVTASYIGVPAPGYGATGIVICEPSSIVIAGKGSEFDKLSSINIPAERVSVEGKKENSTTSVNISEYLPTGVVLADDYSDGEIEVVVVIEPHDSQIINLNVNNVSVINLPEGYTAHVVSGEETIPVEVGGLADDLMQLNPDSITAQIDALELAPRLGADETMDENTAVYAGVNDGKAILLLPSGVTQYSDITLEVVINYTEGEDEKNDEKAEE